MPEEAQQTESSEEPASLAGYEDAEPVSPDENPGDASKELNEAAHEAYAQAGQTESEGEDESSE